MSDELKSKVVEEAKALAVGDGEISDQDRKPVVFCTMQDLEGVLVTATEDAFLTALKSTQEKRFQGWQFREVYRETAPEALPRRDYPFRLDGVLPWWTRAQDLMEVSEVEA